MTRSTVMTRLTSIGCRTACQVAVVVALLLGCSDQSAPAPQGDGEASPVAATQPAAAGRLVVYCGRSTSLVKPVIDRFSASTGIEVDLVDGSTTALAARLRTEGDRSEADVFWAQDPAALGQLAADGRFTKLPTTLTEKVDAKFVDAGGMWVGTSGRARVLAYSPNRVSKDSLPTSVFDLTDAKWKGRVGWAPSNGSFQAFVTAMRKVHGEEKTLAWLKAMKANDAQAYPKNTPIIEAIAAGEIDLGIPNHYYLLRFKKAEGEAYPVEQAFFEAGDIGNLVLVAGLAIVKSGDHPEAAERFIEYVLGAEAQSHFTQEVFEYPLAAGVPPHALLVSQGELGKAAPAVEVQALEDVEGTVRLLQEAGLF